MKRVIALFSGGVDSTVLLYYLREQGYEVTAFTANFGQTAQKDLDYVAATVRRLDIPWIQVDIKINKPESISKLKMTPNRNTTLLSMAAGLAKYLKYDGIAYGAHHTDHGPFPDCRPEFVTEFQEMLKLALGDPEFKVVAPFIYMKKSEVIKVGSELDVPFKLTRSCYTNEDIHCGGCGACLERSRAFTEAGIEDPTEYRR